MMEFSTLSKTWILDVDGTLVKHNGYKIDGHDTLLPGVAEFFAKLPADDCVILLTARPNEQLPALKRFLAEHHLRYTHLIAECPLGERILINDAKPSGLRMSYAIDKKRDTPLQLDYHINPEL